MEKKIIFPKGSLTFKRLKDGPEEIEKTPNWKVSLKEYTLRKAYLANMEKFYPGKIDNKILSREAKAAFKSTIEQVHDRREQFKHIPSFTIANNYQITFKHPKWSKVLGPIVIESDRSGIKDSLKAIREQFVAYKNDFRKFRMKTKTHHINSLNAKISYKVSGGAIYMPEVKEGVYVKFLKDQEKRVVFSPKAPKDKSNYVGVELEFLCDVDSERLGLMLFDAGVGKQVTLTKDESIKCCVEPMLKPNQCTKHNGKLFTHELCILLKENDYKDTIKKVCDVLSKVNAIVNKSCGMHVHLDMRNRDAEKAYQNLISAQGILFKMNPKSRSEKYAKKNTSRDFEDARRGDRGNMEDRYLGINPMAMNRHTTIETRIHSGTIDYTKITNWIEILLKVANHKDRIVNNYTSGLAFCKDFGIDGELKVYMKERMAKFKSKKDVLGTIDPEAERGVA